MPQKLPFPSFQWKPLKWMEAKRSQWVRGQMTASPLSDWHAEIHFIAARSRLVRRDEEGMVNFYSRYWEIPAWTMNQPFNEILLKLTEMQMGHNLLNPLFFLLPFFLNLLTSFASSLMGLYEYGTFKLDHLQSYSTSFDQILPCNISLSPRVGPIVLSAEYSA